MPLPKPNMSVQDMKRWKKTDAYKEYRSYRDEQKYPGYTNRVTKRATKVIRGNGSKAEKLKVQRFIARHRGGDAGERRFGSGKNAVSAHTAALRNWGYDPTGSFSSE